MVTSMFDSLAYGDDDFKLHYEVVGEIMLLHCSVDRWTHNVLKKIYRVFVAIRDDAYSNGILQIRVVTKNDKFAQLFGFEHKYTVKANGEEYEEMICQKW